MAITVLGGVSFRGAGSLVRQVLNYYPGNHAPLYITSSYRPHSTGSHHQTGNAVDVASAYPSNPGPMRDVAKWLYQFSGDLTELIHTPGGYFVKNGRRVGTGFYSSAVRANHYNHVHVAMTAAQARRILAKLKKSGAKPGSSAPAGMVRSIGSQQKEVNAAGYTPKLVHDKKWGPKTAAGVKWYQKKIGVTADAVWGKATEAAHQKYKKGKSSAPAKKASPSKLTVDGAMGPATVSALQRALGVKVDGKLGPVTIKALQKKVGAKQDGVLGRETVLRLQQYLNRI